MRLGTLLCLVPLLSGGCLFGGGSAPPNVEESPPDASPPDAVPVPDATPPPACVNATNTLDDGHHYPGLDCMAGNCHSPGGDGPPWTVAGTLYSAPTGGAIVKYATITVTDATGARVNLVTALNGNFYTAQVLQFPVTVFASECPSLQVMTEQVQYGSCNACHQPNAANTGQISLPVAAQ